MNTLTTHHAPALALGQRWRKRAANLPAFGAWACTLALTGLLTAGSVGAQTPTTEAEITKIDRSQARITLKHGEIRNLELPAMTMVFRVREPNMLNGLAVGERVRFAAEKLNGNFTVTAISKLP